MRRLLLLAAVFVAVTVALPAVAEDETIPAGEQTPALSPEEIVEEPAPTPAEPTLTPRTTATPRPTPTPTAAPTRVPTPTAPRCAVTLPWPTDLALTLPAPEVSAALAGAIGVWEGTWDTGLVTRVGIEQIDAVRAVGVYAYPEFFSFQRTRVGGAWTRFTAQVEGETVVWQASQFIARFRLSSDGGSLLGERQLTNPNDPNLLTRVTLSRCSPG